MFVSAHWRLPLAHRLPFMFALSGCCLAVLASIPASADEAVEFESGFMRQIGKHAGDAGALALKALSDNELAPGRYAVGIEVNGVFFGRRELAFASDAADQLTPCLSLKLLEELGVKLDNLPAPLPESSDCVDLASLIPEAVVEFDASQLALSVSIPQIMMRRDVAGSVDPARWENGINAAFVNYQVGVQQSHSEQGRNNNQYLYLNSGVNLGAWRLRSSNAFQNDGQGNREWTRAQTYVQRDIPGTHANLTLGETTTPNDVFRSVPIVGAQVASDMNMLPDTQQNYAPVVRGVAMSRSRLEIRQNGFPIYSTYVAAGPYEIDDLGGIAGSGELEIVLTEADGQVRRFTQPYSTMNNLLREGVWRYTATAGRYNAASSAGGDTHTPLAQATLARGIGWNSTVYGGLMAGTFYQAGSLGVAKNFGSFGAVALDMTRSAAESGPDKAPRETKGTSYAIKYNKSFTTQTSVRFAGYRYSTEGYRDFYEAVNERSAEHFFGSRRSQLQAAISQKIGKQSSLNLTLSQQDYWKTDYQQRQFQVNFSTAFKSLNVNLYASQSLSDTFDSDRQIGLSVSMPLEFGGPASVTYDMQKSQGQLTQRAALSGTVDDGRLNYRTSIADNGNGQKAGELSLAYQAPFAALGAGVAQGSDFNSVSLSASGAVLAHGDGVVFGTYVGETSSLVHVPEIDGVALENGGGSKTNKRGYALLPSLQPYRVNRVVLNTDELDPGVEIDNGVQHVVPRRGAIVKAEFPARRVSRLLLTAHDVHGKPLPFGTQVANETGKTLGVVGQAGQLLIATENGRQTLQASWGDSNTQQCQLQVDVDSMPLDQGYRVQTLVCR